MNTYMLAGQQMDSIPTLLLAILVIPAYYIFKIFMRRKKIYDAIEPYGGDKWYPIIGTTREFLTATRRDVYDVYLLRNKLHGPIFRSWTGSHPGIHLSKAEHVEPVLTSNDNIRKGEVYDFLMPWLGEGLVTGRGHKWRTHRKVITPTFHFTILDNMTEIFYEKSQKLVNMLEEKGTGNYFDIYPYLAHCALDIICETAMGVEINAMSCTDSDYVQAVFGILDIIFYRMFHPYLHPDFVFSLTSKGRQHKKYLSILHGFTRKVIQERKELLHTRAQDSQELSEEEVLMGKKKRLAFLDLLLELNEKGGKGLTDEEIREEVDTFMFAGHDTTTVTVCWTLFTLANYPEVQDKVYEELESIFHGEERPITPQDIKQMHYLDRVIKETLRLIPVIPSITRSLDKDVVIDGRVIPAGVMIVIHIHALHKDPQYFPDPERFDPDRFLPERSANRHPYAFIPFSAGPRNCLGQKFAQRNGKVMLATILRRFKVKTKKTIPEMKYFCEIVLRPQDGLELSLELRNKTQ